MTRLTCMLAALLAAAPPVHALATCPRLPSHLAGSVSFRGDRWHVRLHAPDADRTHIELDIEDLVMTGLPVPLRCADGAWHLELPFGLGESAVRQDDGGAWVGGRMLAGDSVRVRLTADAAPPHATEEVRFVNGDVELHGTLFMPHGAGPHPAIVMVHGSGPQGRSLRSYNAWGDFYARRGVAALVYDKRGVQESGGDFRADSAFVGLTGDALAAVAYLATRPDVRRDRIGLGGASQAGWIAWRAARDPSVSFLALLVPPSVSVAEQEIQRVRAVLRAEEYGKSSVDAAVAHTRLLVTVATSGIGWDALQESTRRIADEPWAEHVHRPAHMRDLRWWRDHAAVDPSEDLRALRVPLFAAFSAADPVVPPPQNAGVLRELQAAAHGYDITVLTIRDGDHRLEVPAGRDAAGRWRLPRVSREVTDALTDWLQWRVMR